tara:strand:+ start:305 stop:799 length:495 start_codon:yes stop_codon:yes gene_type:complete
MIVMFDEKTGEIVLGSDKWVETIAYTISPRNKYIEEHDLIKRVGAFFNKASVVFDIHVARSAYKGYCEKTNRPHIHGTIYQLVEEGRVSVQRWRTFASVCDLTLKDDRKKAFQNIYSNGWDVYTKTGHELVASWVSCPGTRGCRYNKKYSGMKSCRHRIKTINK